MINTRSEIKCQESHIEIKINSLISFFKVLDNRFKLVIELENGQNCVTLNYCCASINFYLNFCRKETEFSVLPLYIICAGHDGAFQAPKTERNDEESACKRVDLGVKLLQSVIAEKLYEEDFGRKTFRLDKCQVFHSRLNYLDAWKMSQEELWNYLGREIVNSDLGNERTKFVGFLSCTR